MKHGFKRARSIIAALSAAVMTAFMLPLIGLEVDAASGDSIVYMQNTAGEWIQAADGRWWYRHSDGTYTANGWEFIGGSWYHFDSEGWMQVGWLLDNGTWYFLTESGAMATGWLNVGGKWYYFTSSGAMVTGWHKLSYSGEYSNMPYWNYFDDSGAFVTDSDVLGCSHGYSTFGDYRHSTYPSAFTYYDGCRASQSSNITAGANSWTATGLVKLSPTTNANTAKILFYNTSFQNPNTLAITYAYVNSTWQYASDKMGNWTKAKVGVSSSRIVGSGTIAHEIGHAFGLAHRVSNEGSIMCQIKYNRNVSTPQNTDIATFRHIYGK